MLERQPGDSQDYPTPRRHTLYLMNRVDDHDVVRVIRRRTRRHHREVVARNVVKTEGWGFGNALVRGESVAKSMTPPPPIAATRPAATPLNIAGPAIACMSISR